MNKKKITAKKVKVQPIKKTYVQGKKKGSGDKYTLENLIKDYTKKKNSGYFHKDANINLLTNQIIKDFVVAEWYDSVSHNKDDYSKKNYYKLVKDIIDRSTLITPEAVRGKRNFINSLRNSGVLEDFQNAIGEVIEIDKLKSYDNASYVYWSANGPVMLTYLSATGYQSAPILRDLTAEERKEVAKYGK